MTAVKNFRVDSFVSGLAIKAPVHVATNGPITLSGEQTVNSKNVLVGMRVLVKDQPNPIENGIYNCETSAWQRAGDFDGSRDVVAGTIVPAYRVSDGEIVWYILDGVGADVKLPGTDALTFTEYFDPAAVGGASSLQDVTTVGNTTNVGIDVTTGAAVRIFYTDDIENLTIDVDDVITAPDRAIAFTTTANIFVYNFDKSLNVDGGSVYVGENGAFRFYRTGDAVSSSFAASGGNVVLTCPARTFDLIASSFDLNETPFIDFTVQNQLQITIAGTFTIDYRQGQSIHTTLNQNITSVVINNVPASGVLAQIEIEITQDASVARTITWPASVQWPGGTAPDLSTLSSKHLIHLRSRDGGVTWLGTFASDFS
jgi:hypothetical protein